MEYKIVPHSDYDRKVKIEKQNIFCYSKKQLEKLYPNGDFRLIGETRAHNRKDSIGELPLYDTSVRNNPAGGAQNGEKRLTVSETGGHSKILNRRAGFVHVGNDDYIVLLKSRIPFFIWLFYLGLGLAAGIILIAYLLKTPAKPAIEPLHPLPSEDTQAQPIDGDNTSKASSPEGGGTVSMTYTLNAEISLKADKISMYFKNPNASNHDVMLEMYVISENEETLIASSGRIKAGYGLYNMALGIDPSLLNAGNYEGKYKIIYYNPETGERALVESDIVDLKIKVTE